MKIIISAQPCYYLVVIPIPLFAGEESLGQICNRLLSNLRNFHDIQGDLILFPAVFAP